MAETLTRVIQRADELTEFVAIYWSEGKLPLSAQVKKGLAAAFRKFDAYALAKYNRENPVKLRDVLFLAIQIRPREIAARLRFECGLRTFQQAHRAAMCFNPLLGLVSQIGRQT